MRQRIRSAVHYHKEIRFISTRCWKYDACHKSGIIGSIGGGNLEKTVMEEAPSMKEITRKKYDLSNAQSATLGMICGGKNEILYVPV